VQVDVLQNNVRATALGSQTSNESMRASVGRTVMLPFKKNYHTQL